MPSKKWLQCTVYLSATVQEENSTFINVGSTVLLMSSSPGVCVCACVSNEADSPVWASGDKVVFMQYAELQGSNIVEHYNIL